jgi:putative effector of murein hydrolase LrgA (UPF0299 family)
MIVALAILLVCQLAGEAVVHLISLPIPGPVVGMILLCAPLLARKALSSALDDTADGLLRHLSLLFVPAGVGVVQHLDRLGADGLRLVAVIVLTTALTLAVTALVFEWLARLMRVDEVPPDRGGESAA